MGQVGAEPDPGAVRHRRADPPRPARRGPTPLQPQITLPSRPAWLGGKAADATSSSAASASTPTTATARKHVVLVIRFPRISAPTPGLLDRYVSKMYLRIAGLSFLALLGLFYISTFIDKSDKMFKGQASASMIGQLLVMQTPQFIYYIIPITALLSVLVTFGMLTRSSELTVMKACGVSLYRTALSVILLSLGFSVVLFALEQRLMATANREAEALDAKIRGRQPKTLNILNRQWVMGPDNTIYHYGFFDPQRNELFGLTLLKLQPKKWALASETFVRRAVYQNYQWIGEQGWVQDFTKNPPTWTPLAKNPLPGLESPSYFATERPDAEFMTVGELGRYIQELEASGFNTVPLKVDLQRKLAFPFVTLVMTLLAIPFGVSVGRHGALYGIGLGIMIALTYWVLISVFVAIGHAGLLPPVLAGWAPNILVTGVAGYLFLRART